MFTTLLQTNTECSCEQYSNPQTTAMPKKAKASKPDKEASDAAGDQSGRSSPSAAGASSSFPSPSQPSEYESSPEKARPKSRRRVAAGGSREASQLITAGPLSTYALMSKGRVPTNKIALIDAASDAAIENTMALKSSAAPARKAPSGGSHAQKSSASVATNAEDLSGDDQHTQDADGQEAAPDMHFEVSIHTSCVHAQMIVCACSFASNC